MTSSWGGEGRAPLPATPLPGACGALVRRGQGLVAGLLVGIALLDAPPARAVDAQSSLQAGSIKDIDDYLVDLVGNEAPDRRYAGRVLAGQLRRAQERVMHGSPDSLSTLDARSTLDVLAREIPARCLQALRHDNVAVDCADMLLRLGTRESAPMIRAAAARASRTRTRTKLEAAARALEDSAAESPAPAEGPGVQGAEPPGGALRGSAPPQETKLEPTEGGAP
jgi:hypothetical protein